jgi:protein-tyrosine phosphatase
VAWQGTFTLDGSANARDVGGIPTVGGGRIRDGVLLRSANLQHLTPEGVRLLVEDKHLRRIVDLRTDVEVYHEGPGPLIGRAGIEVHNLSLYPDQLNTGDEVLDEVTDEMAGESRPDVLTPWRTSRAQAREAAVVEGQDPVVASYLRHLRRRPDSIVAALRVIAEPEGATLVHCAAGKDRTGVVVALALAIADGEPDAIFADYAETAENLSAVMDLLSLSRLYDKDVAQRNDMPIPAPGVMQQVFEGIDEEHGGLDAYLSANGWTTVDSDRLRTRLAE